MIVPGRRLFTAIATVGRADDIRIEDLELRGNSRTNSGDNGAECARAVTISTNEIGTAHGSLPLFDAHVYISRLHITSADGASSTKAIRRTSTTT